MRVLFFSLILFSVMVAQDQAVSANPCDDPIYMQVVGMSLDSMSERQYAYFIERHEQCRDYEEKLAGNHPATQDEIMEIILGYTVPDISPCEDPIYKRLVVLPLDSLSDRQYTYFLNRHDQCRDYEIKIAKRKARSEKLLKIGEHEKKRNEEEKVFMGVLWSLLAIALIAVVATG
jgi:hypothetical protein